MEENIKANINIDPNLKLGLSYIESGKQIDKAVALINKSARKGTTKSKSFYAIAEILRKGIPGLDADVELSRRYYDAALSHFVKSNKHDGMDFYNVAEYFYYGYGTEPADKEKAKEYYNKALEAGYTDAQARLSAIDAELSLGSFDSKPSLTNIKPMNQTNEEVEEKKVEEPVVEEVKEEKVEEPVVETPEEKVEEVKTEVVPPIVLPSDSCEDNEENAEIISEESILIEAIRLLDSPASSDTDHVDGLELVKTACEKGSMRAAVLLGYLYEGNNSLVAADYNEAKRYYELAISRGSCTAEYRLAMLLLKDSPLHDDKLAHSLIISSAKHGYSYALKYLGDCFRLKVNDTKNLSIAYRYYALAGERGLGLAYHEMAEIDASRQELDLAKKHEEYAMELGYDPLLGTQDPLFCTLHI